MEFLKHLLKSSTDTNGMESILHVLVVASLKVTTESVVESQVETFKTFIKSLKSNKNLHFLTNINQYV